MANAIALAGKLEPIHVWIAILVGHATRCTLSIMRFRQGRWRSITVDIEVRRGLET
jgi:MATE family, multidrug efflux pump